MVAVSDDADEWRYTIDWEPLVPRSSSVDWASPAPLQDLLLQHLDAIVKI